MHSSIGQKLQQLLVFLSRIDTISVFFKKTKESRYSILLSCHDVDRAMIQNKINSSPLFIGLKTALQEKDISYYELSNPFGVLKSSRVVIGSLSFNYATLLIKIYSTLLSKINKRSPLDKRVELESYLYRRVLINLKINIVFAIDPPLGLCEAARSMNIKVVELMHGNNYSMSDEIFKEKFNRHDKTLPTDIVAFDDCTFSTLNNITEGKCIRTHNSINPWHNYCEDIVPVGNLNGEFKRKILVSLQWGYDGEREPLSNILDNGVIHSCLIKLIKNHDEMMFCIRLHPIQLIRPWYKKHRQLIFELSNMYENVEIEYASSAPLNILLKAVDLHITMSSSCTGEASNQGVPTLLLCPTLHEDGTNYGLFRELYSENSTLVEFGFLQYALIEDWVNTTDKKPRKDILCTKKELAPFYLDICEL
ncbi:hypothetical protein AB4259_10640 [Vibrio amylolyticus]|uniref:hypothetical protein n=1 Tax=Vibrio amylolyticus TaxID=2847292 RepID=UPI0035546E37